MKGHLKACTVCFRTSASTNDDGICDKCQKQVPATISFRRKGKGLMPVKTSGHILEPGEWFDIKRQVDRFFSYTPFEEIDALNKETRRLISQKRTENSQKARVQKAGYVYVIRSESGLHKIGNSVDVEKRLDSLRAAALQVGAIVQPPGFSTDLQLVHSIKCQDVFKIETCLHRQLAAFRIVGEWFDLPDEELGWLLSLDEEKCQLLL